MAIWNRIFGGWRTWGPFAPAGNGAFATDDSHPGDPYQAVDATLAMKLTAFWACVHLRSETIGSLPIHLRDEKKNIIKDHDLYEVLHDSPNSWQTPMEYWSLQNAHLDVHGNAINLVTKTSRGRVVSLEPFNCPDEFTIERRKSGALFYKLGQDEWPEDQILHFRSFNLNGSVGLSRLEIGRRILSAQLQADEVAMQAFKQSVKVGGFLIPKENLKDPDFDKLQTRLKAYSQPENRGKLMTLFAGMEVKSGKDYAINPVDAQLLESRNFGVEEICRLMNTPPQLIGHSDKASSWASSIENINLHFQMYGLAPICTRIEQRAGKSLLSPSDRTKYKPKFSMQSLFRADTKTMQAFFASGLQNGYLNRDEVRDYLERTAIPGGAKYTVQMNMTDVNSLQSSDGTEQGNGNEKAPAATV